ncbi:hypothetical protein HN51_018865 [Arachis hypogaea]
MVKLDASVFKPAYRGYFNILTISSYCSEELFRIGLESADRDDIHSLLPGNDVDDKIIHMVALTMTGAEVLAISPRTGAFLRWSRTNAQSLHGEIDEIYVPMLDALGHWFLMLVSFKDRIIYNLDSSSNQFEMPHREDQIRKTLQENKIRATTAVNLTSTPFNKLKERMLSKVESWRMKSKKNI